jgi:hypothetical protein
MEKAEFEEKNGLPFVCGISYPQDAIITRCVITKRHIYLTLAYTNNEAKG